MKRLAFLPLSSHSDLYARLKSRNGDNRLRLTSWDGRWKRIFLLGQFLNLQVKFQNSSLSGCSIWSNAHTSLCITIVYHSCGNWGKELLGDLYYLTETINDSAGWRAVVLWVYDLQLCQKIPFSTLFWVSLVMTRSLLLLPFEELDGGLSSRTLIEEAERWEQSVNPHGNMCPKLAHLQKNSSVCHPGQNLNLGSPTWLRSLAAVARASVVTVTGKEIEMFWGVTAWRVTSVAMGSLSEGAGVINIASRP